jgi:hypothetical protein
VQLVGEHNTKAVVDSDRAMIINRVENADACFGKHVRLYKDFALDTCSEQVPAVLL